MITIRNFLIGGVAGNVFRGMATLALGGTIAKIVGIVSIPILTRIYSPTDFGVLALFSALVSMVVPILTLRYVLAIPLPRHDGTAMNLLVFSAALMSAMTMVILVLLYFFSSQLLGLVSMDLLVPYWWLIGLTLFGTASYELASLWATRKRAYGVVARTQVLQGLLGAVVKIALGLLGLKPLGLLVGQAVNLSGGVGALFRAFVRDFRSNVQFVSLRRLRTVGAVYWEFPVYRLPSQFLLQLSMQAPLLFAASFYDAETTGQLGLALMAVALPVNLLGQSMSTAYHAEASKLGRRSPEQIYSITIEVLVRLGIVGALPAAIIFLFGEQIFHILFGSAWRLAGVFASTLSLYMLFQFVSRPVPHIFSIFGHNRSYMAASLNRMLIVFLVFWLGYYFELSLTNVITIYSAGLSLHYILLTVWAVLLIRSNFRSAS